MEALMIGLGGVTLLVLVLIYGSFVWAFIAMKFYAWFILTVPVLSTLPEFSFMQWVGIMLFLGVFKNKATGDNIKKEYKEDNQKTLIVGVIAPWLVLLVGWLFKIAFF